MNRSFISENAFLRDFRENVSSAFEDLREDKEFTDVTLACEDGQQVEAHRVVLIASSPFFLNILKRNKHRTRNKMRVAIESGKGVKVKVVKLC